MFNFIFSHIPALAMATFVLNFVIAAVIIFLERKNPSTTLAWCLILFLLPIIGAFLYFMLSNIFIRNKVMKYTTEEEALIQASLQRQMADMECGNYQFTSPNTLIWMDMLKLHQILGKAYYTQDNEIEIITDGKEMFDALLNDIKNAKISIDILYFIVKPDEVGMKFLNALTEKAKEGVQVRLLADGLGSKRLNRKVLKDYRAAGGKFVFFFPLRLKYINPKLNYRNHRKLVIIDDAIGYLGGFNIGREYLGLKKKFGYWRDTQLRIQGSAIQDMKVRFLLDWRVAAKEKIMIHEAYASKINGNGTTGIQIVSSGPHTSKEEVKRGFNKMITTAQRKIWIQTPYFVPSGSLQENLKVAILSGVDVRIMIPSMPDHLFVYWATWSYIGVLLRLGAKVYIYDNGFLHAKTMVVDGEVSTAGTANFDRRSFKLSFETNVFIYGSKEAKMMEDIFIKDLENCHELTAEAYARRGTWIKAKESICRLLSDLL